MGKAGLIVLAVSILLLIIAVNTQQSGLVGVGVLGFIVGSGLLGSWFNKARSGRATKQNNARADDFMS